MSTWWDIIALVATLSFAGAVVLAIFIASQKIQQGVESTKEKLKSKGLLVSKGGVAVKTELHFDRQDYVDATQRGIIKAMSAASFRQAEPDSPTNTNTNTNTTRPSAPTPKRQHSTPITSITPSADESKKRGIMKRAFSASKEG